MRTRDEVFSRFQEFKALMENWMGVNIKVLRSNNGGDYTRKTFKGFYSPVGIKKELAIPYNPQHNRVVERKQGHCWCMFPRIRGRSSIPLQRRGSSLATT
jgi:transposase InsO family protein